MLFMQALELKSNSKGFFDWQLSLSDYDYQKDLNGNAKISAGNPYINRTGTVTDLSGTGWTVLDMRGTLRPQSHTLDIGYHLDDYQLRSITKNSADWSTLSQAGFNASSTGNTSFGRRLKVVISQSMRLQSLRLLAIKTNRLINFHQKSRSVLSRKRLGVLERHLVRLIAFLPSLSFISSWQTAILFCLTILS